eukprot:9343-Heterococcus_DN1.PRE.1
MDYDVALAASQLVDSHTVAAARLREDFEDASAESIIAALELRGFLHPQLLRLCEYAVADPQAAWLRGQPPPAHESTCSDGFAWPSGNLAPSLSLFCGTTSSTCCAACKLSMQHSLLLKLLYHSAFSTRQAVNLNVCNAFHPELGVPVAAFLLYMNVVRKYLRIEDRSRAYWTLLETLCQADEERIRFIFKEQDATQYCLQAQARSSHMQSTVVKQLPVSSSWHKHNCSKILISNLSPLSVSVFNTLPIASMTELNLSDSQEGSTAPRTAQLRTARDRCSPLCSALPTLP